jgi:two-component system NarL family sensor kinase
MAMSLRPPVLDDIGTAAAIGWLCQHFADTFADIAFHIEIDVPNSDIPDDLSTPIYRIVQEALNNVVKHAAAETVLVALRLDESMLRLEVLDDGIGFENSTADTGSFQRLGKIGRLGMRERALNSNGHLTIESWPGEGTKVTGEWSLADATGNLENTE